MAGFARPRVRPPEKKIPRLERGKPFVKGREANIKVF